MKKTMTVQLISNVDPRKTNPKFLYLSPERLRFLSDSHWLFVFLNF